MIGFLYCHLSVLRGLTIWFNILSICETCDIWFTLCYSLGYLHFSQTRYSVEAASFIYFSSFCTTGFNDFSCCFNMLDPVRIVMICSFQKKFSNGTVLPDRPHNVCHWAQMIVSRSTSSMMSFVIYSRRTFVTCKTH